jgi:hypothetical protein
MTFPLRLIILHLAHIGLTDGFTFTNFSLLISVLCGFDKTALFVPVCYPSAIKIVRRKLYGYPIAR